MPLLSKPPGSGFPASPASPAHPETIQTIDARGLLCPLPVLRLIQALRTARAGQILVIHTTDPAAAGSLRDFCREQGLETISQQQETDGLSTNIRIPGATAVASRQAT